MGTHETIRPAEEVRREGTEAFLTGRVPQLQTHRGAFHLDHLVAVVDANGRHELRREDVLVEPKNERCFSARGIAYHEKSDDIGALGPHL